MEIIQIFPVSSSMIVLNIFVRYSFCAIYVSVLSTLLISWESCVILVGYLCFSWCSFLFSNVLLCLLYSMGSSYVIIGALGVITLCGVTVVVTPGGDTVIGALGGAIFGTSLGTTLVWVLSVCIVFNNFPYILMTSNWLFPIVKGVCGMGGFSTCISSLAALVACSVEDNHGMTRCYGKNSTTSACLSLLLLSL